jgi:hypothetical protein
MKTRPKKGASLRACELASLRACALVFNKFFINIICIMNITLILFLIGILGFVLNRIISNNVKKKIKVAASLNLRRSSHNKSFNYHQKRFYSNKPIFSMTPLGGDTLKIGVHTTPLYCMDRKLLQNSLFISKIKNLASLSLPLDGYFKLKFFPHNKGDTQDPPIADYPVIYFKVNSNTDLSKIILRYFNVLEHCFKDIGNGKEECLFMEITQCFPPTTNLEVYKIWLEKIEQFIPVIRIDEKWFMSD